MQTIPGFCKSKLAFSGPLNPLRPNSDLSETSHSNIQGLSVSEGHEN